MARAPEQPRANVTPIREGGVYDSRIGEKLAAAVVRLLLLLAGAVLAALLWRAS
jgi:hypothetical protein